MTLELTKKQTRLWRLLDDPKWRRYLIDGAARSSKTTVIIAWLINEMNRVPGLKIACLRQHRTHAKQSLYDGTIKPMIQGRPEFIFKDTDLELHHINGSVMRVDGLDDDAKVDKILGTEYAYIFLNEASQIKLSAVKVAMTRLSQNLPNLHKRIMIFDTNPKGTSHWLYKMGIQGIDPITGLELPDKEIWKRMSFTTKDNPFLPKDTISTLDSLTGVERKRMFLGEWCSVEGLAYPEFNSSTMVKHIDCSNALSYIVGVDSGYNDPIVMSCIAILPNENNKGKHLHLCEVFCQSGRLMSISAGDVAERWKDKSPLFVIDPSAGAICVELKARGFRAELANNKLMVGISAMRDCIASGRLTIEPSAAIDFIDEIGQYELDKGTELPIGNTPDHCLDSVRYACVRMQKTISGNVMPNFVVLNNTVPTEESEDGWRSL